MVSPSAGSKSGVRSAGKCLPGVSCSGAFIAETVAKNAGYPPGLLILGLHLRGDLETEAAHRDDRWRRDGTFGQLGAQAAHVHVHGTADSGVLVTPHLLGE